MTRAPERTVNRPTLEVRHNVAMALAPPLPADLQTPCLVVDRDVLEGNLVAMADAQVTTAWRCARTPRPTSAWRSPAARWCSARSV